MQTFLPYPEFGASAAVLDRQRLGKQRVECLQILKALTDPTAGWNHHPVTNMWRGYEAAFVEYSVAICDEWTSRGYKDTCRGKILDMQPLVFTTNRPPWLGNHAFHASHRSNLLRKFPEHYGQFGWTEPMDLAYVYPT
jgi:ribosome modulation factor